MTAWYHRLPDRFAAEVSMLRATTNAVVQWDGTTLVADEDIVVGEYHFGIQIAFPDDYPNEPPVFWLRYPAIPPMAEVHLYREGSICLLGPDEWSPRMTAAGLRARAVTWAHCLVDYLTTGRFVQPTRRQSRR